jgi:hypothetical protein
MTTGREMAGRRVPAAAHMTATGTTHMTATTRMAAATATTGMAAATAATGMATATTTAAAVLCERRRASQDRPQNAGRQKKAFALNAHGCHLP